MAKSTKIRWTKARKNELRKEILNFNRRIRSAESRLGDLSYILPQKQTASEAMEKIQTLQEYRDYLAAIKRATAKTLIPETYGNDLTTEWRRKEIEIREKRINERNRQRRKKVDELRPGVKTQEQVGRLNPYGRFPSDNDFFLRDLGLKTGDTVKYEELLKKIEEGYYREKAELWRTNYINALINEMLGPATFAGDVVSMGLANQIYDLVTGMDISTFLLGQLSSYSDVLQINFLYDQKGREVALERILDVWNELIRRT